MRVLLPDQTLNALRRLQERFSREIQFSEKNAGPFVCRFIELIEPEITDKQVESLAPKMISPKAKEKLKRERWLKLYEKFDESKLLRLEKQAKKKARTTNETAENQPLSAENR